MNQTPTQAGAEAAESVARKGAPLASGVLDYFPDALWAVAQLSQSGNDKHNPGEPLHWSRGKSGDEADALMRHLKDRGGFDTDGLRHSTHVAWRSLALLQKELEDAKGLPISRGSRAPVAPGGVLGAACAGQAKAGPYRGADNLVKQAKSAPANPTPDRHYTYKRQPGYGFAVYNPDGQFIRYFTTEADAQKECGEYDRALQSNLKRAPRYTYRQIGQGYQILDAHTGSGEVLLCWREATAQLACEELNRTGKTSLNR